MLDKNVAQYFNLPQTEGDVGIEIEMEMADVLSYNSDMHPTWRLEEDGSLKGYGYEWVMNNPCPFDEVKKEMDLFTEKLAVGGNKIVPTIRAGVHVHVNMQKNTLGDVYKLAACYYPLETVLARFCGAGRSGNLFCLRARDAEEIIFKLEESLNHNKQFYLMRTNNLRYAALNYQSLFNYGSLEFRGLGTTADLKNIAVWVEIIRRIKEYAVASEGAWDAITTISGMGPRSWVEEVVGPDLFKLIDYEGLERDVMEDVRLVQTLCHDLKMKGW